MTEPRLLNIDISRTGLQGVTMYLTEFMGSEGISMPFSFELTLLSETHNIDFEKIIGENVTVSLGLPDGSARFFNGIISRFSQGRGGETGGDLRFSQYRATLVPWFWLATRYTNSKIFQELSVPEIVEQIFNDREWLDFENRLERDYEKRTYCVQYRETDFNFISRLLEEEGIYYFFEHENNKHTLILADVPEKHLPCPNQEEARYQTVEGGWLEEDVITSLEKMQEIRSQKCTFRDFNFETPSTNLEVNAPSRQKVGPGEREIYDYPGEYGTRSEGDRLANLRMEEEELKAILITGSSICRAFTTGYRFKLQNHYRSDMNDKEYVLTYIDHEANEVSQAYSLPGGTASEGDAEFSYRNQFACIPFDIPFRPARRAEKKFIQGPQTAIVVGPQGEEIYTDKYGRVKVQFHWDRIGEKDDKSSCWIRVASVFAGGQYGAIFTPRIGQEVIVDFLEGNPDQPLITGRVYNADLMPPYTLPDEKTKSTIKTNSSIGAEGFNEIRFEDKKGEEQIFIHAEKDIDIHVKSDRRELIGNDRHLIVKRDLKEKIECDKHVMVEKSEFREVKSDYNLKVGGKKAVEVTGSSSLKVTGNVIESFNANHSENVTATYHLKGMNLKLEAATGMELVVGGSSIVLTPAAIFIKGGPLVHINSGSGPPVSPASAGLVPPAPPVEPVGAADASPGKDMSSQEKRHKESKDEGEDQKKSWIEIELVDEEDNPVPGERYKVTLPDGKTVAEGTLDEKGYSKISGIDPGTCKITFPALDKDAWEKASGSGGSKKQTSGSGGSTQKTSGSGGSTQQKSDSKGSTQKTFSDTDSSQKGSGSSGSKSQGKV
jgi:type VI secretion system secreted protein VgrG